MASQSSQSLPEEEGFNMERPAHEILPTPPLPPKNPPAGPDLLDISGNRVGDSTSASTPGVGGDLLSEAISRAMSNSENLPDACWDVMDNTGVDLDPQMETTTIPDPSAKPQRRVFVLVDTEDEFRQEEQDVEDGMEQDQDQDPPPASGETDKSSQSRYPPPNQLAAVTHSSEDFPSQASLSIHSQGNKRYWEEIPVSLHGATAVCPPPGTLAERITSAIGRVNFFCPVVDVAKNGEPGFLEYDFPKLDIPEFPDPTPKDLGEDRFFSVKELASSKKMRTIPLDDMAEFLLLAKDQDQNLYVPSTAFFDLVVSRIEVNIITKFPNLRPLHWGSSKWKGCGVLELAVMPLLEEWRLVLSKMVLDNGLTVDTFPKASLLMGADVTALLKDPYREYGIRWISHSLMYRNKAMRGNVRLTHSKTYGEHDLTRFGTSMYKWKMVYLAGDCVFMEFLSKHPISHRFIVGPSTVVLKGGIRKPGFLGDKSKFTWTKTTYTPALLEPVYSLKPSAINPPVFKGLAAATANLSLKKGTSSSQPTSTRVKSESFSPPVRSASDSSSFSSSSASSSRPSASAPPSSKKAVQKKASSSSSVKPKTKSARLKAKAKRTCC